MSSDQAHALVAGCDTVWHCAALSSPWGAYSAFKAANVEATAVLAEAALQGNVDRFVHISTPALYFDFTHRYNVPESFRPTRFVNHYAATKAQAEQEVLAQVSRGLHATILRPRAIFGPYDQVLLPRLLRILDDKNGKLILPRGGNTLLDLTYAGNVVHAMQLASTKPNLSAGCVFNITNGVPVRVRDVLEALFERQLGRPMQVRTAPYALMSTVARAMELAANFTGREPSLTRYSLGALAFDMTLDISRACEVLGYLPQVSMAQGVVNTAQWFRSLP
jgi:nucleoside-diphosphate-sugar epimerase